MLSNSPVDSMGLLEVKCVMKDSVKYSEVVALWVTKWLQQFGFCRHYMFVILKQQDTLLSECACQCVEYKINHTLIKNCLSIKYSNMCGGLAK